LGVVEVRELWRAAHDAGEPGTRLRAELRVVTAAAKEAILHEERINAEA
jgi:hypothetical protein